MLAFFVHKKLTALLTVFILAFIVQISSNNIICTNTMEL